MIALDQRLFLWISGLAGKFGPLDWLASHLANDYFIPALMGMIAFGLWFAGRSQQEMRRNQWAFVYAVTGVGFSALAVMIMNHYYFRPRPYVLFPQILPQVHRLFYEPTVSSFPSYPAALTFALAFGIWLENKKVATVLFGLAALMAFARIYVGVHYPSDIVVGALLGIVVTYVCGGVLKLILRRFVDLFFLVMERLFLA